MSTRPLIALEEALRLASQSLMFETPAVNASPTNAEASVVKALAAQALAAIALAEEQRTANLIALAISGRCPLNVEPRDLMVEAARRMGALR